MGTQNTFAEIAAEIQAHDAIVVVSHYSPDPDAFGSSCALSMALRDSGKKVITVNEDGAVQEKLGFVPGSAEIQNDFPDNFSPLLIACDCGDGRRVGDRLAHGLKKFPKIINIDHHASNDFFGTLNYVEPHASSTSELILKLLEFMKAPISAKTATALFLGLSADTGSFKYSATTAETFAVAGRLVGYGAVPWTIAQSLYANTKFSTVKLQAEALAGLTLLFDGKAAEIVLTEEMAARHGADAEETDELKHIAQSIQGVRASTVIRQAGDLWRVSLRSRDPKFNVGSIAELFGGGGHNCAAAFRWRKSLDELRNKLRPALEKLVTQS